MNTNEKKQRFYTLMQSVTSLKNTVFYLERAQRNREAMIIHEVLTGISKEMDRLSKEIKDGMFK